ncbi:MAG: phosphopantetheine-binding protein [Campylobacterota bacterium]|nr:phosphopantetheine-binding protein [Campylobacterota bacterium]
MNIDDIKKIIVEQILDVAADIEEDEIGYDDNIQESLEIDSFDFLKILTAINEKTTVEVPEKDYSKVDSVNNMAEYILNSIDTK